MIKLLWPLEDNRRSHRDIIDHRTSAAAVAEADSQTQSLDFIEHLHVI